MVGYLPAAYFALPYFGLVDPVSIWAASLLASTDHIGFSRIASMLAATREFASVGFPEEAEQYALTAQASPALTIVPRTWEEIEGSTPDTLVRTVKYSIVISLRITQALTGLARLSRLGNLCQNLLDGSNLAGLTLPGRTSLSSGTYQSEYPEARLSMDGEFAYLIARGQGRDISS